MMASAALSAPRPPPSVPAGPVPWLAKNLFATWVSSAVTLVMVAGIAYVLVGLLRWAVLDAIWTVPGTAIEDTAVCRVPGAGACWALILEKHRFILFGLYPYDEQWRPAVAVVAMIGVLAASANRRWWGKPIIALWLGALSLVYLLLAGGAFGLSPVSEDRWGGLPVTLLLATTGIALAFPIAIAVALGRLSGKPTLRFVCLLYVELIRGVPLVSILFMGSVLFPLFLPDGTYVSKLMRAQIAIVIFIAAYLSEIIRGGLQTLDAGQGEAATSLGLSYWQAAALVRLPQALTLVLPPMVNLFIGFFKSTSLVLTIGILDLLNAAKNATAEPAWQGFGTEAYLFAAAIYFAFCFAMSRYGLHLERRLRRAR